MRKRLVNFYIRVNQAGRGYKWSFIEHQLSEWFKFHVFVNQPFYEYSNAYLSVYFLLIISANLNAKAFFQKTFFTRIPPSSYNKRTYSNNHKRFNLSGIEYHREMRIKMVFGRYYAPNKQKLNSHCFHFGFTYLPEFFLIKITP